jgi:hypothetical protein
VAATRRTFTVAEANAEIPRLALLVARLQDLARRLDDERRAAAAESGVDPGTIPMQAVLRARPPARRVLEELDGVVGEIDAVGAQLKDLALGLVDFPGEVHGRRVLLCWQLGEPEVAFYHGEHDGFAGRRPLPGADPGRWLQ